MSTNYEKSNAILNINFDISHRAKKLTQKLLRTQSTLLRQRLSIDLLDELADCARIDIVKLKISSAKQYHKKSGGRIVVRQYGYYRPQSKYIYITNKTAVRGQILAPKTFLNTLLHEWMHHYDFCKLGLNSIHTRGFYMRLKSLRNGLENDKREGSRIF